MPQGGAASLWTEVTVGDILKNAFYIVTLIKNRYTTKSYKDNRKIKRPESDDNGDLLITIMSSLVEVEMGT
ncbi:MAG: hypothetical protein ACRCZK_04455 [Oscillospiraceae bacterium]